MTEKAVKKTPLIKKYRDLRRKLNLNQTEFWGRIGCTQSAGSRYESNDRDVPIAAAVLAHEIYIKGSPLDAREYK